MIQSHDGLDLPGAMLLDELLQQDKVVIIAQQVSQLCQFAQRRSDEAPHVRQAKAFWVGIIVIAGLAFLFYMSNVEQIADDEVAAQKAAADAKQKVEAATAQANSQKTVPEEKVAVNSNNNQTMAISATETTVNKPNIEIAKEPNDIEEKASLDAKIRAIEAETAQIEHNYDLDLMTLEKTNVLNVSLEGVNGAKADDEAILEKIKELKINLAKDVKASSYYRENISNYSGNVSNEIMLVVVGMELNQAKVKTQIERLKAGLNPNRLKLEEAQNQLEEIKAERQKLENETPNYYFPAPIAPVSSAGQNSRILMPAGDIAKMFGINYWDALRLKEKWNEDAASGH